MAGKLVDLIRVSATGGDCIADNRPAGVKSNTGTYFLCSEKTWPIMEHFFQTGIRFFFDIRRIAMYCSTFPVTAKEFEKTFPKGFAGIEEFGRVFSKESKNVETKIGLRHNDQRYFVRFENNGGQYETAFRHLLYSDISVLVFEKREDVVYIYPEFDFESEGPLFRPKSRNCPGALCYEEDEE